MERMERLRAYQALLRHQQTAEQLAQRLVQACEDRDGDGARAVYEEATQVPDVLMLLLTNLTTQIVNSKRRRDTAFATAEELGVDASQPPELWQVATADQVEAAAQAGDFPVYAVGVTDAMLRAVAKDFRDHYAEHGHWPDVEQTAKATMLMQHSACVALAAELLRRTLIEQLEGG